MDIVINLKSGRTYNIETPTNKNFNDAINEMLSGGGKFIAFSDLVIAIDEIESIQEVKDI
ncbi:hypothetical protein NSS71_08060 [Niallia sp. FSL W8-0951]|uniref:hypothetical protein n=1 Tax=Niallia sp. FSL W8-0951 TaxID=2954639 RepID=UPI0030F8EDD5